jgi:hypothetical protein
MSRQSTTTSVLAALALVVAVGISGCSQGAPSPAKTSTQKASSAPSKPTAPTATPTPTFVPAKYTCDSIVPPATLAEWKKTSGFTLQNDFVQRVHNYDANLSLFDDYGGILCQWAYEGASNPIDYGFSSITASQATAEQATLTKDGYVASSKDHGTVLANPDSTNFPDNYLFIDGYWFYASQAPLLDLIVENVFSTN